MLCLPFFIIMGQVDSRFIELPNEGGSVYVIKDGKYVPANIIDMTGIWSPTINDEEIVLAIDEDMTPFQLTGTNTEVNI